MRYIVLSEEERDTIKLLQKTSPNYVVRQRCNFLSLSEKKLSMKDISVLTDVSWFTVSRFFNAWEGAGNIEEKIGTLQIKEGRGAKNKLDSVKDIVPDLVQKNSQNLNAVLAILKEEHQITICKLTLQNFLKDKRL
jgi:transposase